MSEEKVNDPEVEKATAVDPPNNAEESKSAMSSGDSAEALPVDPPQNT